MAEATSAIPRPTSTDIGQQPLDRPGRASSANLGRPQPTSMKSAEGPSKSAITFEGDVNMEAGIEICLLSAWYLRCSCWCRPSRRRLPSVTGIFLPPFVLSTGIRSPFAAGNIGVTMTTGGQQTSLYLVRGTIVDEASSWHFI
ncbi:hypothetical protein B0H14DRAFT_2624676 [Mycena olivaceomarginata]|nr:hypothetical protein B0H14DRAFT_2624676 [Mycena olivaceomarginata]